MGRQAGGRAGRGLPRRSFPGAALPPLPRPPHRPAGPARLFPHGACSRRAARAAPPAAPYRQPDSDGQQSRDTRCWLPGGDQSSVWSVFKQDGLGRALPSPPQAPPALAVPPGSAVTGVSSRWAKQRRRGREELCRSRRSSGVWGGRLLAKVTFRCVFHS